MQPQRKLKILYFIGSLRIGGAEKQIVELALRLPTEQFEVQICCLAQAGELKQIVEERGIPVTVFSFYLTRGKFHPLSYFELLRELYRIYRHFRKEKPDIIHCYLYTAYVVGIFCGWLAGIPLRIASRRGLGIFKEGKPWKQWLENWANRMTHCVLVNSEAVRRDVLRREKINPAKITLIYNGVDLSKFDRPVDLTAKKRQLGLLQGDKIVGVIANLIHYKGHRELLQATALLTPQFPELRLVLVGRDGGILDTLKKQAQELNIEPNVIFTGSRQDTPELLQLFDLCCLASHEEGFSNVILEAMAARKPMIATTVGGNPEAVVDGETGILVPPRDPRALARAIEILLLDEQKRLQMGEQARKRAERLFSVQTMVENMRQFYFTQWKKHHHR